MSRSLVPERGGRNRITTPTPQAKLARGTRDISPATIKVARGTRELSPLLPLETEDDTIVVDTDTTISDALRVESDTHDVAEVGEDEVTEVSESQADIAAAIDARMIELGK